MRTIPSLTRHLPLALLVLFAAAAGAAPPAETYQAECGACHIAYPPRFLPAASWQRLVEGLADHFGTDASVDAAVARELADWLGAGARRPQSSDGTAPPLRITATRWFRGEHDEISASRFRSPAVGSPANCVACHPQAASGRFSERDVRIPR